jgi:hypothetical protein
VIWGADAVPAAVRSEPGPQKYPRPSRIGSPGDCSLGGHQFAQWHVLSRQRATPHQGSGADCHSDSALSRSGSQAWAGALGPTLDTTPAQKRRNLRWTSEFCSAGALKGCVQVRSCQSQNPAEVAVHLLRARALRSGRADAATEAVGEAPRLWQVAVWPATSILDPAWRCPDSLANGAKSVPPFVASFLVWQQLQRRG